jgi:hypothetical protein
MLILSGNEGRSTENVLITDNFLCHGMANLLNTWTK